MLIRKKKSGSTEKREQANLQTRLIEISETLLTGFPAGLGVLRANIHDLRGSMSYIMSVCLSIIQKKLFI